MTPEQIKEATRQRIAAAAQADIDTKTTLSVEDRAAAVEAGVRDIIKTKPRNQRMPLIRALNVEYGSPFDKDDLKSIYNSANAFVKETEREGAKPLIGIQSVLEAVNKSAQGSGYLIKFVIPMASFTLVGGPPKVGKTSIVVAMLIRAFLGHEGVAGLKSKAFSHLTIFSDDQRPADTARYINAAIQGLEDPSSAIAKLQDMDLSIYPNLVLDEEGAERLADHAAAHPGGVYVIDSLTSTAGKLGYDENSTEISRVVYELREAIQSVDPTATVILIHHMKKGGTGSNSQVDSFRGSSAITGAVDNIMTIERPQSNKNGNAVAQDLTSDRVVHLIGRTIGETKIVVRSDFQYVTDYNMETEEETYTLKTIKLDYLCDAKDYTLYQDSGDRDELKVHSEWLTDPEFEVLKFLMSKKQPQQQKYIAGNKSTVSKSVKTLLLQNPPLIEKVEYNDAPCLTMVADYEKLLKARITNPNLDY